MTFVHQYVALPSVKSFDEEEPASRLPLEEPLLEGFWPGSPVYTQVEPVEPEPAKPLPKTANARSHVKARDMSTRQHLRGVAAPSPDWNVGAGCAGIFVQSATD